MKGMIVLLLLGASASIQAIPQAYSVVADRYSIPPTILYAIAFTESGYQYRNTYNPWPWTLNIEGKAYRFINKASTLAMLEVAIQQKQSVDIGMMQINWRWHQHRFKTVASALDPRTNLRIGAEILLEQYHQHRDWWLAVGQYHAPAKSAAATQRAERYRLRVKRHWRRINQQ